MTARRKICVVTGSRAEYGLLYWLMKEIQADPALELQVAVTGMHLTPEFGSTWRIIEQDGFPISARIECQLSSDTSVGMAKSAGLGMLGFADALDRLRPDVVALLGDRYEILAVTQVASLMGIPVAHISGGEVTRGAVDDWIRHSITKSSWLHFVATDEYRKRVIQLGEEPDRVFNVGDPGLDSIQNIPALDDNTLMLELGILSLGRPLFLVTYHPATLGGIKPEAAFSELLRALDAFPSATIVLTKPNADAGSRSLISMADDWVARRSGPTLFAASLGQRLYLNIMRRSDCVIGNSSSGIVEAPALKVPTVNIGSRQDGRLKATSVIDCEESCKDIRHAVECALAPEFRQTLATTVSIYGDCGASSRIKHILSDFLLPPNLVKSFHDV